jgi:hypothetical protein
MQVQVGWSVVQTANLGQVARVELEQDVDRAPLRIRRLIGENQEA